jgi:hypothetical protein
MPIMDMIQRHLTTHELYLFNICRLYTQVWWLSDITTGDGRYITTYAIRRSKDPTRKENWHWPDQGLPPQEAWEVWTRGLHALGVVQRDKRILLNTPLGPWTSLVWCDWFYDGSSDRLLRQSTNTIYVRRNGRATRKATKRFVASTQIDTTFHRDYAANVIIGNIDRYVEVEGMGNVCNQLQSQTTTFRQYVSTNPAWAWWYSELQYNEEELLRITHTITTTGGLIVSDGSFKDEHGTASIVLEGSSYGQRITTSVTVPGSTEVQCAYRSEAAGLLAAVQLVNAVTKFFNLKQGKCTLGCDGQSALVQCFYQSTNFQVNIAHFDIISEVRQEIAGSVVQWHKKYIPGHQEIFPLDREATLNNEMDQMCKNHWVKTFGSKATDFLNQWEVATNGTKITTELTKSIREYCSILRAETYWCNKLGTSSSTMDWESTGIAMRNVKRQRQVWITKHSTGFCSVGRMAKRVGLRDNDRCPRCDEEETAEHVWRCQHTEAKQKWEQHMQELRRLLNQLLTPTTITNVIIEGLNGWRNGIDTIFNSRTPSGKMGITQSAVGWKHFFEGRMHKEWKIQMIRYYKEKGERRSGNRWASALIRKMWDTAWDLWEHRNGILHDKSNGYDNMKLNEKIEELWAHPSLRNIASIRQLINGTVEDVQGRSSHQKQQWVLRIEAALKRYQSMVCTTQYHQEREGMRKYLSKFKQ